MSASKFVKKFSEDFLIKLNVSRTTSGMNDITTEFPEHGLVRDGTPCGENLVCVNQTCVSLFPYIDTSKCPTNSDNAECSGKGVRIEVNKLFKLYTHTHTNKCSKNFKPFSFPPSPTFYHPGLFEHEQMPLQLRLDWYRLLPGVNNYKHIPSNRHGNSRSINKNGAQRDAVR